MARSFFEADSAGRSKAKPRFGSLHRSGGGGQEESERALLQLGSAASRMEGVAAPTHEKPQYMCDPRPVPFGLSRERQGVQGVARGAPDERDFGECALEWEGGRRLIRIAPKKGTRATKPRASLHGSCVGCSAWGGGRDRLLERLERMRPSSGPQRSLKYAARRHLRWGAISAGMDQERRQK